MSTLGQKDLGEGVYLVWVECNTSDGAPVVKAELVVGCGPHVKYLDRLIIATRVHPRTILQFPSFNDDRWSKCGCVSTRDNDRPTVVVRHRAICHGTPWSFSSLTHCSVLGRLCYALVASVASVRCD